MAGLFKAHCDVSLEVGVEQAALQGRLGELTPLKGEVSNLVKPGLFRDFHRF